MLYFSMNFIHLIMKKVGTGIKEKESIQSFKDLNIESIELGSITEKHSIKIKSHEESNQSAVTRSNVSTTDNEFKRKCTLQNNL